MWPACKILCCCAFLRIVFYMARSSDLLGHELADGLELAIVSPEVRILLFLVVMLVTDPRKHEFIQSLPVLQQQGTSAANMRAGIG